MCISLLFAVKNSYVFLFDYLMNKYSITHDFLTWSEIVFRRVWRLVNVNHLRDDTFSIYFYTDMKAQRPFSRIVLRHSCSSRVSLTACLWLGPVMTWFLVHYTTSSSVLQSSIFESWAQPPKIWTVGKYFGCLPLLMPHKSKGVELTGLMGGTGGSLTKGCAKKKKNLKRKTSPCTFSTQKRGEAARSCEKQREAVKAPGTQRRLRIRSRCGPD